VRNVKTWDRDGVPEVVAAEESDLLLARELAEEVLYVQRRLCRSHAEEGVTMRIMG